MAVFTVVDSDRLSGVWASDPPQARCTACEAPCDGSVTLVLRGVMEFCSDDCRREWAHDHIDELIERLEG